MTWKRSILCLVCVGTVFVTFISMAHRSSLIISPNGRMGTEEISLLPHYHNRLTNGDFTPRYTAHSSLMQRTNPSLQSQSSYEKAPLGPSALATPTKAWTRVTNRTTLAYTLSPLREDKNRRNGSKNRKHPLPDSGEPSVSPKTEKELQQDKGPKAKKKSYNREFQWDDRDPNGWKNLPLSTGEPGEKEERVIFNRVAKCGSRSMIWLIRELTERNNFNLISSVVYNGIHIPKAKAERIVSVLDEVQTPYLFQRHLQYLDFQRHNAASDVVYINVIRDPISRMVSHYYYSRFGDGQTKVSRTGSKKAEKEFNETIDECVRNLHQDCSGYKYFYIIPFFCGNFEKCMRPSKWALNQAIHNVQKHYIVVGILEEFDLTLRMLEKMLPGFFAGATELYHTDVIQENRLKTSTNRKIPPSNETIAILRKRMEDEYVFYNFIRDRLHKQAESSQ